MGAQRPPQRTWLPPSKRHRPRTKDHILNRIPYHMSRQIRSRANVTQRSRCQERAMTLLRVPRRLKGGLARH